MVLAIVALGTSGCRVCANACKKEQGPAVAGIAPQADGTLIVTTCSLVTEGTGATLGNCREQKLPRP
jgi:hypothetical protein